MCNSKPALVVPWLLQFSNSCIIENLLNAGIAKDIYEVQREVVGYRIPLATTLSLYNCLIVRLENACGNFLD